MFYSRRLIGAVCVLAAVISTMAVWPARAQSTTIVLSDPAVNGPVLRTFQSLAGATLMFETEAVTTTALARSVYRANVTSGPAEMIGSVINRVVFPIGSDIADVAYAPGGASLVLDDQRALLVGVPAGLDVASLDNWGVWVIRSGGQPPLRLSPILPSDQRIQSVSVSADGRWVLYHVGQGALREVRDLEQPGAPVVGVSIILQTVGVYVVPTDRSQPPLAISAGLTLPDSVNDLNIYTS